MPLDWSPLWLSIRYAGLSTLLAAVLAVPSAALLKRPSHTAAEPSGVFFALLLPPAVFVYYLLTALGRWPLTFEWRAAVVLSTVCTLPAIFAMSRATLGAIDPAYENAAGILGASEWWVFWRVRLPLAWRGLVAAILAGFARALVDFGLTAIAAAQVNETARLVWLLLAIALASLAILYAGRRLGRARAFA